MRGRTLGMLARPDASQAEAPATPDPIAGAQADRGKGLPPSAAARAGPTPFGLLFFPFAAGVAVTLILAVGIGDGVTATWVAAGIVIGLIAAASVLAWTVTHNTHPATTASRSATHDDPLAHIHAVEAQGRRHSRPCFNCGTPVSSGASSCANCGHKTVYECKGCQAQVRLEWNNCPECGRALP